MVIPLFARRKDGTKTNARAAGHVFDVLVPEMRSESLMWVSSDSRPYDMIFPKNA